MPKARKKPIVIDFFRLPRLDQSSLPWLDWVVEVGFGGWGSKPDGSITIPTLEGTMTANVGDIIIKGVSGEFYPCKSDIFEKTYEIVEE